jgi:hypothetical protein
MTGFTRKVDYSGVEKLVTRWMKDVNGTEVDADAASIRSSRSFRGTAGDYISRRASVVKPVNWIHASHELNPSITVGAIVKDKDMELLATAAEIERFGVHRDSRKETTDFDEAPSPITGSQAFSIDHSQGFTNVTTEELNTMCARNYATGAVKLEKVREQLRNQKAGNTIYLVVGTKTAHGGNKHTSHPVTGLRAPTSASGSSKKSQADSPSAEDHQVQALQLRPLRVTSRNTASRGTLSPTTFAAPNF